MRNLNQLRAPHEPSTLRRMLRLAGAGSVFFGLLAVARGIPGVATDPLGKAMAIIGFLLAFEGVWIVAVPRPSGLILEGIAFAVVGLWNLLLAAVRGPAMLLTGLGLVELAWGFQYFRRYARLSKLMGDRQPATEGRD